MMERDIVEYLERLSLLKFTEDERKKLVKEIEKIIDLFNNLLSVRDLDRYEPLFYVHDTEPYVRDDEALSDIDAERRNISSAEIVDGFVKGPRTVVE